MTARDEILAVFPELRARLGRDAFSPAEIIRAVEARGTAYPESTLRTHIVSIMCFNAPNHHGARTRELERIGHGMYRLRSPKDLSTEPAAPPPVDVAADGANNREWPWEGAVQARFVHFLGSHGWQITRVADTGRKERGVDVLAEKGGRAIAAEVKGYPLKIYADPRRSEETKRTHPSIQAGTWYSGAVVAGLMFLDSHPEREPLVVLPEFPRYRALASQSRTGLSRAGVSVVFVDEDGSATSETWSP